MDAAHAARQLLLLPCPTRNHLHVMQIEESTRELSDIPANTACHPTNAARSLLA